MIRRFVSHKEVTKDALRRRRQLPKCLDIILVRGPGMNIDAPQLQSAWKPERREQNKLLWIYLNFTLLIT